MDFSKELVLDIYDKVTGKSDMDWSEIVEKNKLDCHTDTLRKAGVGIKMAADAGVLDFKDASTKAYDDLYKAKKQFYDQRREYNKLLTNDARWEHIYDELIKAAKDLAVKYPLLNNTKKEFKGNSKDAVLVLSDWHYGLTANNLWNTYNTSIARQRLEKLNRDVQKKLKDNSVRTLHVVLLGDMISGGIHNSIRVKNSEDVVQQIMEVCELIAELVNDLSEEVYNVKVYSTWGNHARVTADLKDSVHSDNLERIIPFWLNQRFNNKHDTDAFGGIEVVANNKNELLRITACGHEICGVHGDLDTPGTNPMLTLALLFEKLYGKKLEVLIPGHFHHLSANESMDVTWLGVSSLCGTDEYAKDKRLFSKPSQTLLFFDEEGLDSIHNIDLSTVQVND